jgi:hypothetical protein
MNNLTKFDEFKNKRTGKKLNEGVVKLGNEYIISDIEVPVSLVNAFVKKVKDEANLDLRSSFSDQDIAYRVTKYCIDNFLQIDNLPVSIITGESDDAAQAQPQSQTQPQTQTQTDTQSQTQTQTQPTDTQTDTQTQTQTQTQPVQGTPTQPAQPNVQKTASEISPEENK